jgi:TatD family-associated radical SAM protein
MPHPQEPATVYWLENTLYLNITNKCSNNCYFCLKNFKKGVSDFRLKLTEEPSIAQVIAELQEVIYMRKWAELVFCGFGEPTQRLDCLLEVTRWIRQHYGKPLRIRVNTNGHAYMLNDGRDVAKELKAAGVDKVSVSLNAHDQNTYDEVCKPKLAGAYAGVLDFIEKAKLHLEVEVTAVRIPEVDVQKLVAVAEKMNAKLRLREYIPCFW